MSKYTFRGMVVLVVVLLVSACAPGAANPPAAATQPESTPIEPQEPAATVVTSVVTETPVETTAPVATTEVIPTEPQVQGTAPVIAVTPATPVVSGTPALPATGGGCPLTDEEYAVYSAVIQARFLKNQDVRQIVLKDTTVGMMPGDIPPVQEDFLRAQKPDQAGDLLADLTAKMIQPCQIEPRFDVQVPVHLLSEAEQQQAFAPPLDKAWTNFYARFPGAQGMMEFSRVGFSEDGNVAVVYMGNQQGGLAGGGYNFVLEKGNSGWTIVAEVMTWIS